MFNWFAVLSKKGFTHVGIGIAITRLCVYSNIASAQSIPELASACDDYATIAVNQNFKKRASFSPKTDSPATLQHNRDSTFAEEKMFVGNVEEIKQYNQTV